MLKHLFRALRLGLLTCALGAGLSAPAMAQGDAAPAPAEIGRAHV